MAHQIETVTTTDGTAIASMAFSGARTDIWHRLGQSLPDRLMTGAEAMRLANMDREVRVVPAMAPEGVAWAEGLAASLVVLEGKVFVTESGDIGCIPDKVVGVAGAQAAAGHADLSIRDRFELAELAIHASDGRAVWSTAGLLRDGRQGFACMEAPTVIVDPKGVADIVRSYLTVSWSFDGSRATELAASNIRVLCANTQRLHDQAGAGVIKVKATAGAKDRMALAARHWAMAQDAAAALALEGERMLRVANGRKVLGELCEKVLGICDDSSLSDRTRANRRKRLDEVVALYHAPTNMPALGDNGYAAYQTVLEYLDWFVPVKSEGDTGHLSNQLDLCFNWYKEDAAELVLSMGGGV